MASSNPIANPIERAPSVLEAAHVGLCQKLEGVNQGFDVLAGDFQGSAKLPLPPAGPVLLLSKQTPPFCPGMGE